MRLTSLKFRSGSKAEAISAALYLRPGATLLRVWLGVQVPDQHPRAGKSERSRIHPASGELTHVMTCFRSSPARGRAAVSFSVHGTTWTGGQRRLAAGRDRIATASAREPVA